VNAPPQGQDSLDDLDPRSITALEAEIASKAKGVRQVVADHYPGEMGKAETDLGKATWKQLGIEKKS
jgi:hypothetical protein